MEPKLHVHRPHLSWEGCGDMYILSDKRRKKMSTRVEQGHVCPEGRHVVQLPAASKQ